MPGLSDSERRQLASLELRVEVALQAAQHAPEPLRELLIDAMSRLRVLEAGAADHGNAVESVERALAALEAWQRWRPSSQPSA